MALASELVEVIADATGTQRVTMTRYARFAREAGLLSQSGRGKSAAHMRPGDATNLLICLLVNSVAQEAATYIENAGQMDVYHRDADSLDERHTETSQREQLHNILPILFDREHTFPELLLALTEIAIDDWQGFEERFGQSQIYFHCDEYEALVDFTIYLDDAPIPAQPITVSFSYNHPLIGRRSPNFRRSTQMSFAVIARIGQLMAPNPKESNNA